jgi:hypothetical protein
MDKSNTGIEDVIMIGFDHKEGESATLVVGRKEPGDYVDILNIFKGEEAIALYNKLAKPSTMTKE